MKYIRALGFFVTTLLMYLAVPLLGWGLGDLAGFFRSGPRAGYALAVGLLGVGVAIQSIRDPKGIRGGVGIRSKMIVRQRIVRFSVIAFMYTALVFMPFADRRAITPLSSIDGFRWMGLVFSVLGFAFILWSGVSLGRYYSADVTVQKEHKLVKDGLYRYIRHPRYLGALLLGFGLALVFNSLIGIILIIPFTAILLFRISDEEKFMMAEFGLEWEIYCQETWRLAPYIY